MTAYQRKLLIQNHWRTETAMALAIAATPPLAQAIDQDPRIALMLFDELLAWQKIAHGDPDLPCPLGILRMNMERDRFRHGGQPPWRPPTDRRGVRR